MPIRFRCAYCNQLMGIASRKAGTVVRCPKCAGEIIVPTPEGPEPPSEPAEQSVSPLAFEDLRIDQIINEGANGQAAAPTETAPTPAEVLPPPPSRRLGLFLPLGMLIVSMVVVILLLILVFILGIIIGKQSGTPETKTAAFYVSVFV